MFLVNFQGFIAGLNTGGEEGRRVLDPVVPSIGKVAVSSIQRLVLPAGYLFHVNNTRYRDCIVPYLVSKLNGEAPKESELAGGRRL